MRVKLRQITVTIIVSNSMIVISPSFLLISALLFCGSSVYGLSYSIIRRRSGSSALMFSNANFDTQDVIVDRVTAAKSNDVMDADTELINRLNREIMLESGVELDQLINPSKVVNLERDLENLRSDLMSTTLSDSERESIQQIIDKKQSVLNVEKRAVMRGWLKNLFVGQSVLAGAISLAMVYDVVPGYHLPLALQVMGFWMWWLFIIPSLRARKPQAAEKEALNIAFLASPIVSIAAPVFTKDVAAIWWLNAFVTGSSYAYGYASVGTTSGAVSDSSDEDSEEKSVLPLWIRKALKALDYGSGKERGLRK